MAGESATDRPLLTWGGFWPAINDSLLSGRRRVIALAALFFVVTFLIYWYLGPRDTPFITFVNLANAFLHGRLDLAPELSGRITEPAIRDGKAFANHPPMPAVVVLPGVLLFGLDLNQTLVSAILGAITAAVVFGVTSRLTEKLSAQLWLSVLFIFGTIFWYAASHGGVWFFAHTSAVLFLFLAIYVTLTFKHPLFAGLLLGAAFWSRQPTIFALPFFVIMFSDQWFREPGDSSFLKRIDLKPLILLGAGLGVFVLLHVIYNYARFDSLFDAGYFNSSQIEEKPAVFNHGVFHISYIGRHIPIIFERMPRFTTDAPYVSFSWAGMAIWATTPAFFYALFAGIRNRWMIAAGSALIFVTVAVILSRAIAGAWDLGWARQDIPYDLTILPFVLLIGLAIVTGVRNKFVIACWAAIIPIALTVFTFAATGWAQFGYRYALDFYPFLFLLTVRAVGDDIRWHHKLLILLGVAVNLMGVLWIYQFEPRQYLDLRWVGF